MRGMTITLLAGVLLITSAPAEGSISKFDYYLAKLKRLPVRTFDGTALTTTNMRQMATVKRQMLSFASTLKMALKSWNAAKPANRSKDRLVKLQAEQKYLRALIAAFNTRIGEIKAGKVAAPAKSGRGRSGRGRRGKPEKAAAWFRPLPKWGDKPVLIDHLGMVSTSLKFWRYSRPMRWVPDMKVFVGFHNYASDDRLVLQVVKGRKKMGKPFLCSPRMYEADAGVLFYECRFSKKFGVTKPGKYGLKISYKQTLQGKTHELGTLRFTITTAKQCSQSKPCKVLVGDWDSRMHLATLDEQVYPTGSGISGHFKHAVAGAFGILKRRKLAAGGFGDARAADNAAMPFLRIWFKSVGDDRTPNLKATCFYKGKKVGETPSNKVRTPSWNHYKYWTFKKKKSVTIEWQEYGFPLRGMANRLGNRGVHSDKVHYLDQNPGEYRCVITGAGNVLAEVFFTAGDKGVVEKPACQEGSLRALPNVSIIKVVRKKGFTAPYSKKAAGKPGMLSHGKWAKGCPL